MGEIINSQQNSSSAKRFLVILIPLSLFLGFLVASLFYFDYMSDRTGIEISEKSYRDHQAEMIRHDFAAVVSDLNYLAQEGELIEILDSGKADDKRDIEEEFLRFSEAKGMYDQIRFLNDDGMEIVRVNYNNGRPRIVPDEELQPKGNRYYFRDTFTLEQGQVFVSPLDLNIEHGQVESPLKPMIRFGTPVFDSRGQKRGIIVLNYFGAEIIDHLKEHSADTTGRPMLLNSGGYWLAGPDPEDEWGFMFEDKKDRTFNNAFPDAWRQMVKEESGQFYNHNGLFTYGTVYPLLEGQKSSAARLEAKNYYWKIVFHVPKSALDTLSRNILVKFILIYVAIIGLLGAGMWFLDRPVTREIPITKRRLSPFHTFIIIAFSIFASEILVMYVVHPFRFSSPFFHAILDSTLLVMAVSPVLYLFLFRPLILHVAGQEKAEMALKEAKGGLEIRVEERTFELKSAVDNLKNEITERIRAEHAIRLQSEIINNMAEGVNLTRASDARIVYTNPKFDEMFGYGTGELIEKHVTVLNAATGESQEEELKEIIKTLNETGAWQGEIENTKKDGTHFWSYCNVSTFQHHEHGEVYISVQTNITERKKAEEALKESEEKFRSAFESSSVGLNILGPNYEYLVVNKAFCDMVGYSEEELMSSHFRNITHPDDIEQNIALSKKLRAGEIDSFHMEKRYIHKKGRVVWGSLSVSAVWDAGEKLIYFIALVEDITERKSAEDKLQEEKNKLEATMGAMEMGLTIQNPNYEIIYQNKILTDAFGRLGEKCYRVYEGKDEICEGCPMEIAFKDGKSHTSERKVTMPSGEIAYWENTANPIRDAYGNIVSCLEIARNITDRKKAEEELKASKRMLETLFDNAPFMIWGTDEKGVLNYFNKKSVEVMGYTHDEAIGMFNMELHPPHKRDEVYKLFKEHVDGKMEGGLELPLYTKLGKELIGSMAQTIYEDEFGKKRYFGFIEDITERKSAERALQEGSRLLEESQRVAKLGSYSLNVSSGMWSSSEILDKIFGITDKAFTKDAEGWLQIIHPEQKEEMQSYLINHVMAKRNKFDKEYRIIRLDDKQERWVHGLGELILDENQNPVKMFGTIQDITERKKAAEAILESEEKFRSVAESASDAIISADSNDKIISWNNGARQIFGYEEKEALGKPLTMLMPKRYMDPHKKGFNRFISTGESKVIGKTVELEGLRKDGTEFPLELSISTWETEKGKYFSAIIRDITERKESEEAMLESEAKFRTLFEDSKDAVYITSREGSYIDANQSTLDLLGYTKEEILEIEVMKTYVNPDDREKFQKEIEEKGYVRDYEIQFQKKDGARMDCLLTASVRKDAGGSILGYQGIIRDVTKEKILQQQLIQSEKLSSIGTFVAGVAHELNNPLTAVSLYSESLKEYDIPFENAQNDLNIIIEQSRRASNIVRNLLKFSRKHKPGKSLGHINDIMESVLSLQENHFRTDNIEIKREFANDIPEMLADSNQLQQVIMNIILNAEHEMKKARGRGTITAKTEKKGKEIVITLENDGPPIPKDKLSSIFDPFYTTKDVGEGTGLGLYISFGIVKEHGGNMRVENIGKAGVRFVITLPISDKEPKSERDDAIEIKVPRGARILFVDDEKHIRDVMARNLLAEGMFVQVASNGKEAIELLEQNQFDVVISDVKMPNMSGMDVGKWLNKNNPVLLERFILATGAIDPEIDDFCRQYGCDAITKPFEIEKLLIVIGRVLGKLGETGHGK